MRSATPSALEATTPLSLALFDEAMARFGPFESKPRLALAVSGGADSLCLAVLARDWSGKRHGEVRAFVVDHGLREGSAGEAGEVVKRLAALDVHGEVLTWRHDRMSSGLQEAARKARYRLLRTAAAEWEALHLLVAHHADDQSETVAMRKERGSGPVGLSGMASVLEFDDLRILRPLLAFPRTMLVATLCQRGIDWIDDPSNADPRFARTILRASGRTSTRPDARVRLRLDAACTIFLAEHASVCPDSSIRFERAPFRRLPADVGRHVIGRCVLSAGSRQYFPPPGAIERLWRAAGGTLETALTLGGCVIRFGKRWVRLRPERPEPKPWHPPVPLCPAPFGIDSGDAPILLHSCDNLCST